MHDGVKYILYADSCIIITFLTAEICTSVVWLGCTFFGFKFLRKLYLHTTMHCKSTSSTYCQYPRLLQEAIKLEEVFTTIARDTSLRYESPFDVIRALAEVIKSPDTEMLNLELPPLKRRLGERIPVSLKLRFKCHSDA